MGSTSAAAGNDSSTRSGFTDPEGTDSLGRLVLRSETVASVLHRAATVINGLMPAAQETSVTMVTGAGPATAAWTGLMAFELDECQYGLGYGPCLHSADIGHVVVLADTETDERWPGFAQLALRQGVRSVLAVPVPINTLARAALNVYSGQAGAFDPAVVEHAERLATQAAVTITNMHDLDAARTEVTQLQAAITSRSAIEQAKGALMAIHGYDADTAFQTLVTQSQQTNVKVRDLAAQVLTQVSRTDTPTT